MYLWRQVHQISLVLLQTTCLRVLFRVLIEGYLDFSVQSPYLELTTKIDQLEIELTAERNAREVAETKLEEVEFELAESQAGGENVARKTNDDDDEEGDDSNNDYLLGEIEDLKVILFYYTFYS